MDMLEVHAAALRSKVSSFHEFLSRFSKYKKVVYGFVEGKQDICFYRGFIDNIIPDEWKAELWPAGNRDQVLKIHKYIDWRRFPKKRVCFFVDRDLSDLIPQKMPSDTNIYVTDNYSIENSIVNRDTCQRMLTEIFGFSNVSHEEVDQVCDQFERELEVFLVAMIPTMAWILFWRRTSAKANLNNINIGKLMSVRNGAIVVDKTKNGESTRIQYVHKSAGISYDPTVDVSAEEAEFSKAPVYRRFVRGKYVLWFLVMFCKSIHSDAESYFSRCTKPPKMNVSISPKNAVTIIGNLARVPPSLRIFLKKTFRAYAEKKAA